MAVLEAFVDNLNDKDRRILLMMAWGLSDEAIAKESSNLHESYVQSLMRSLRRQLSKMSSQRVMRSEMALFVIESIMTPAEVEMLTKRAKANLIKLRRCNLLDPRVQSLVELFAQPQNFSATYAALATAAKWGDGVRVRRELDPLLMALGGRVQLQVTFYLLASAKV